ncbi:hydantoinase/oxoprolinase family protein [Baekduia soli]|uniref:Hydantoinase/oxoprolinase family protein n=1 Tax=Baekduia soli TaxID=496014 RepID=A0A5B8U285_9ACTN|nr:hydantoinase/oxoprolinase family protein [Baekduia soli]QEC46965.1 hydantoinase/oxoprolinase family protein [Baekduia soli]
MGVVLGVDIGGTFTDCIAVQPSGEVQIGKAFSTPPDFHDGFIASIASVAQHLGTTGPELLAGADGVYHGCTVGTNALVEGRTAKVALLTTRGHRDSLFQMKAGRRLQNASPAYVADVAHHHKPAPLVPRDLVREVDERIGSDGDVVAALNEPQLREAVQELLDAGAEAIAISLLWSIRNDAHELRAAEIVREMAPGIFVSVASQVVHRSGEYERTVATVMNALIGPVMDRYLAVLQERCTALGFPGQVQIMTCSGGLISTTEARRLPVLTIGSGPVAGLIGSHKAATAPASGNGHAAAAAPDVITADMGGTTFDVGLVHNGVALSRRTSWHDQYEYWVPTLDVRSVGAGGGSIIRFDPAMGSLRVGPESASAVPGPVCVGRGGTEPTVTDANLVAGILDPGYFLAGEVELDVEAARAALAEAGRPLGLGPEETAAAALRIVDNGMADAIRLASVQKGIDPRGFTLYAYGGAGPVHGASVARHVGMSKVVVPLGDFASGWSAFGIAGAAPLVVQEVAQRMRNPFDAAAITAVFDEIEARAVQRMADNGIAREDLIVTRHADMRYSLQVNEIEIDAPAGDYDDATLEHLVDTFQTDYERVYGEGTGYADAGFAVTGLRVRARARPREHAAEAGVAQQTAAGAEPFAHRDVILYEAGLTPRSVAVYRSEALFAGAMLDGPAIVELPNTTIVVPGGATAAVDARGNVTISLED